MEVWQWQQENLAARRYSIHGKSGLVGMLAFKGWTSNDADFISERISLHFERKGWLEHDVTITFKGEVVGLSKTTGFGQTTTTLVTGEQYTLQGKSLSTTRDLTDAQGQVVMRFEQGNFSVARGNVNLYVELPELTRYLLLAIGLYLKHLS